MGFKRKFEITAGMLRSGNLTTLLSEAGQPSSRCPVTITFGEDPVETAAARAAKMDAEVVTQDTSEEMGTDTPKPIKKKTGTK